jgi:glutamyl-tRNA(Gln) amidotransferase subunit E
MDVSEPRVTFGLEIHQQLATHKLHCHCPSELSEAVRHKIRRELHVRSGELGEVDIAARFEELKHKYFEYEISPEYCCLVELDEEPPRAPDEELLKLAVLIAEAFDAEIVDRAYVMRKTILDGSNVSGFQRTTLIAYDGRIVVDGKEVRIPTICLEEDAARKILATKEKVVYRLDRLGIPLVEISTEPVLETPRFAKKVAEEIGLTLRMLGVARRGIGTIRQDVNVSVPGGARVELKGVPTLDLVERAIALEAERQRRLLELRDELRRRGITPESFQGIRPIDVSEIFRNSKSLLFRKNIERGLRALAIPAPGFADLFQFEILPGKRFGKELAEMLAALTEFRGLIHSDEILRYHVSEQEVSELRKLLGLGSQDGFVIILGEPGLASEALELIRQRLEQAAVGVPKEVRRVLEDGSSVFLRPMPGAARMYPETDIPSLDLRSIRSTLKEKPRPIWELRTRYRDLGLNNEMINHLLREALWKLFEKLMKEYPNVQPIEIAKLLVYNVPRIEEKLGKKFDEREIEELVKFLLKHQLNLKFAVEIIKHAIETNKNLEEAFWDLHPSRDELLKEIQLLKSQGIVEKREIIKNLMKKFAGRVDVSLINELLKE